MNQVIEFFNHFFSAESWPARWHCGRWTSFHGWLYIASSIMIAAAYFSIPFLLFSLIKKAKNKLPFKRVFWLFLLFILLCGVTHTMDALMFWFPLYRVSAIILFITGIVSCMAAYASYKIFPLALALKSPFELERIIEERTEELRTINEHLQETNAELEETQNELRSLVKQKDDFLSIASHELKTPVTSLKVYAHLLSAEDNSKEDEKLMIKKMNTQIDKLTELINEMLDSSKLQDGKLIYNKTDFILSDLIKNVVDDMQSTTAKHKLTYSANSIDKVHADKERITQVVENLISNAIKYSRDSNEIFITLERKNNELICSVKDTGLGIPEDQQGKIFERFYRVSGDNMITYPGMGLGLYIVKDIIERHSGKLWLDSKHGVGSTFYFSLNISQIIPT